MEIDLKAHALAAGRGILRAVVRIMLKHGVMHREFVELSKEIYVEVARDEYGLRGRPTNVARMVLLTGLDRKEIGRVKKKLELGESAPQATHKQDRIARVLSGWYQDADYLDSDGKPLILPLQGSAPSFDDLIRRYGGDVPAITILRELERVEVVGREGRKRVKVLRRNYRLDTAEPEALVRSGSVLEDIGRTVTHNLYRSEKEASRFEARASNVNIPAAVLPQYRSFIYAESQSFLEKVDAWLTRHEISDQQAEKERALRLGIGMYWIQSDRSEVV